MGRFSVLRSSHVLPECRLEAAMTDERLSELEAVCGAEADEDGKVKFYPGDVLELIHELRELRKHAADLSTHAGAIANLHGLLANLCAYGERSTNVGDRVSSRIPVQDPGR
jgi:hypothetical protein